MQVVAIPIGQLPKIYSTDISTSKLEEAFLSIVLLYGSESCALRREDKMQL